MNSSYIRLNETLFQERLQAAEQARRWRAISQVEAGAITRLQRALSGYISTLRGQAKAPATTAARHSSV